MATQKRHSAAELHAKLLEAQETLDAIRSGEVDAVVVEGADGPKVYTLRSADHPYRVLIESMHEGAITLSRDGLILYSNRRFADIAGIPLEQLTTRSLREFVNDEGARQLQTILSSLPSQCDLQLQTPLGAIEVHITASEFCVDSIPAVAVIVTDMTQERRRDQELQAERLARLSLEQANRAKDEFLATLSHELRTPLTSVLGWSSFLRQLDLDVDVRNGLVAIEESTRVQVRLIEDLLDIARLSTGKFHLEPQMTSIDAVLDRALATAKVAAASKKITIVRKIDHSLPPTYCDPSRLQQVFWNLLSNAVKFTPEHGTVTITAVRSNGDILVEVTDTGCGIEPDFLPQIFGRFTQAEPSISRRFAGLGLGLVISRDLVELHGGSITAWSAGRGKGSTFGVLLPTALPQATGLPATTVADRITRSALSGLSILAIDDDAATLRWIARLLEFAGASVTIACNSAEAIAAARERSFDVVLSDLAMPAEDGFALLPKLRIAASGPSAAIALTAYAQPEHRDRITVAGFDAFVQKPIDASALVETIISVHQRSMRATT